MLYKFAKICHGLLIILTKTDKIGTHLWHTWAFRFSLPIPFLSYGGSKPSPYSPLLQRSNKLRKQLLDLVLACPQAALEEAGLTAAPCAQVRTHGFDIRGA